MRKTIAERVERLIGELEGLAEDAATAVDEEGLHPEVPDYIQGAVDQLGSALGLSR